MVCEIYKYYSLRKWKISYIRFRFKEGFMKHFYSVASGMGCSELNPLVSNVRNVHSIVEFVFCSVIYYYNNSIQFIYIRSNLTA
jgi:hypothetical protein